MRRYYIIAIATAAIVASAVASMAILGNSGEESRSGAVGATGIRSQQQQHQQNGLTAQDPAQNTGNVKGSDGETESPAGDSDGD